MSDGGASSNVATVSVSVASVNDLPSAVADAATTVKNLAANIPVLANDGDADGDALRVSAKTNGSFGGTVTIAAGGTSVTCKPKLNFTGVETFSYTVSDGRGGTATATVRVTVNRK